MRSLPTPPRPGERVSASLIRDIINAIRERTPIEGEGVRLSRGPNGTVFKSNSVVGDVSGNRSDKSCFRFGTVEKEVTDEQTGNKSKEQHPAIVCCYYNVGGTTKHMHDFDISEILSNLPEEPEKVGGNAGGGESEEDDEEVKAITYLCFKITGTTPSIVAIEDKDLEDEQKNELNYVYPLYRYEWSTLVDDLRNALNVQMVEYIGEGNSEDEDEDEEEEEEES